MNKESIIIIDCISSSVGYIKYIYEAGYEPIAMETYKKNIFVRNYMHKFHMHELHSILEKDLKMPRVISEKKKYSDTLELVKSLNPVAIIQGSDDGIILATKLSQDLGLPGNKVDNLPKMRNKLIAQNTLKNLGIRSIESKTVETYEEALAFFIEHKNKNKKIVMKPVSGISSIGVFVCETEEDLKKAFKYNMGFVGRMYSGKTNSVLLQEYIEGGNEYTFNTVSSKGKHYVTSITKINKILVNKRKVYDTERTVDVNSEVAKRIIEYGLKVLDGIGIEYGATHCEIMYDDLGPVLIEANCRVRGGSFPSGIQDIVYGLDERKLSLESYIYKEKFSFSNNVLYRNEQHLFIKYLIMNHSAFVFKLKIKEILSQMPGYYSGYYHKENGFIKKTDDLSDSIGFIYFAHKDINVIDDNYRKIREIENSKFNDYYIGIRL